jgi:tetratricopeptide (TPR) repeat protein
VADPWQSGLAMFGHRLYGAALQAWRLARTRARRAGDAAAVVRTGNAITTAWLAWGDLRRAAATARATWAEAAALPAAAGDAWKALFNLALTTLYLGAVAEAGRLVDELWRRLPAAVGIGEPETARLRHLAAALLLEQGRWRPGAEAAMAAERDLAALGLTAYAAQALRNAGIGWLELDEVDRAEELFGAAAARQLRAGLAADLAFTRTEQGRAALRTGRADAALECCRQGLHTLLRQPSGLNFVELARICGVVGAAADDGEALLRRAARWLRQAGHGGDLPRYTRLVRFARGRGSVAPPGELAVAEGLLLRTAARGDVYALSPARRVAAQAHAVGADLAGSAAAADRVEQVVFVMRVPGDREALVPDRDLRALAAAARGRSTVGGGVAPAAKVAAVLDAYDRLLARGFPYVDALGHLALLAGEVYDAGAVDRLTARHLSAGGG